MSEPTQPDPVKLIASIFANNKDSIAASIRKLSSLFGPVDYISALRAFDFTDYYEAEMGSSLIRRFITFEDLISPDRLPEIKRATNTIENELAEQNNRRTNIDPGYISQAHLILATGKAYTHRPYLKDGIYADLTLVYRHNSFRPLDWTYPDYAEEKTVNLFNMIRKCYLIQLKQMKEDVGRRFTSNHIEREEIQPE